MTKLLLVNVLEVLTESVTVKVTLLEPKLAQVNELATTDKITIEQLSEEPPSTSEPVMVALPVASK